MKKIAIFSVLVIMLSMFITGCNKEKEQTSADTPVTENTGDLVLIPTLDELAEINCMDNVLKTYTNAYVYGTSKSHEGGDDYIDELIYLRGDGKVDYHLMTKKVNNEDYYYASSVKGGYYSVDSDGAMAVMEVGKHVLYDFTLRFEGATTVGQP